MFQITQMDIRLRNMALEALEQVCAESRLGPAKKTRVLAFALAYLFFISDRERWRYDEFWQMATGPPDTYNGWSRFNLVTRSISGIYHSLGMARTTDIQTKFDAMYHPDRQSGMCNHYRNEL